MDKLGWREIYIKQNNKMLKSELGFTLIELLIVVSVVGIIAGFAVFSYRSQVMQKQATLMQQHLKFISATLENYSIESNSYKGATLDNLHLNNAKILGYNYYLKSLSDNSFLIEAQALDPDNLCYKLQINQLNEMKFYNANNKQFEGAC